MRNVKPSVGQLIDMWIQFERIVVIIKALLPRAVSKVAPRSERHRGGVERRGEGAAGQLAGVNRCPGRAPVVGTLVIHSRVKEFDVVGAKRIAQIRATPHTTQRNVPRTERIHGGVGTINHHRVGSPDKAAYSHHAPVRKRNDRRIPAQAGAKGRTVHTRWEASSKAQSYSSAAG